MKPETYFKKNGFIFGDSAKFEFGSWSHQIIKFTNLDDAVKWLHTEEYDFRGRELISKTTAKKYEPSGYRNFDNWCFMDWHDNMWF